MGPKNKRPKQDELPGVERPKIKEVEDAAEAYEEARDERMKLTEEETEAQVALVEVMKKHKVKVYKRADANPPWIATLTEGKDKASVKRQKKKETEH